MLARLEALEAKNQTLEQDNETLKKKVRVDAEFDEMSDEAIAKYIQTQTGQAPQGNLPRKTLVRMAMDARPSKAA